MNIISGFLLNIEIKNVGNIKIIIEVIIENIKVKYILLLIKYSYLIVRRRKNTENKKIVKFIEALKKKAI